MNTKLIDQKQDRSDRPTSSSSWWAIGQARALGIVGSAVVSLAIVLSSAAPAAAAQFFGTPTIYCNISQVQVNANIQDYPDYLATTDAYWRADLYKWTSSGFVYTGRSAQGRVYAGNSSTPVKFNVSRGTYSVVMRRWNWTGYRWQAMHTPPVAEVNLGGYFTGRNYCSTQI